MDAADAPASTGVMVAFLPTSTDWSKIALPHLTLVYAGTTDDLKLPQINELAKDAASLASLASPFCLRVIAKEVFGDQGEQVDAFRLQPTTELWAMRRNLEKWNKSQHPFTPHVTIGPAGSSNPMDLVPRAICFDRMYVGWGEESLTFWLTRSSSSAY